MHTTASASLGVEGALEHSAEDGWRNLAPVEVKTCVSKQGFFQFFCKLWYLYFLFKQTSIRVRECLQICLQILASLLLRSVQYFEQVTQSSAQILCLIGYQEIMELVMGKDSCILSIQAEHYPDTEDIQPTLSLWAVIIILFQQSIIYPGNYLACLHRNLHLPAKMFALHINKEFKTIVFLAKIFKQYLFWLAVRLLHIIHKELSEITGHYPTRTLRVRQFGCIALSLLKGVEH